MFRITRLRKNVFFGEVAGKNEARAIQQSFWSEIPARFRNAVPAQNLGEVRRVVRGKGKGLSEALAGFWKGPGWGAPGSAWGAPGKPPRRSWGSRRPRGGTKTPEKRSNRENGPGRPPPGPGRPGSRNPAAG